MKTFLYFFGGFIFLWFALAQNGKVPGIVTLMRRAAGESVHTSPIDPTDPNLSLPFCKGCPDHEACTQGACYLNGGPLHPDESLADQQESEGLDESEGVPHSVCEHPGGHARPDDPNGIIGISCEGTDAHQVDDDRFKTSQRRAMETAERLRATEYGEDLSFLKGASRPEREEWVRQFKERHPDIARSEIAHALVRHAGLKLRQAQYDVREALGPADLT